jgi:glycosyltransferase involved in cell wall biosynthesis
MKIFRIIARLNVGGPARHVVWLTRELQDKEFDSVLAVGSVPEGEEDMSYFAGANEVEPVFIAEMSRELSLKDAISLFKIYRLLKTEKPDVIHTHTAKAGVVGRGAGFLYRWLTWKTLIGKPRRVKIIHTFHGHIFHSYYGNFKTKLFLLIEKVLARFASDKIIVITGQQFKEIHEKFGIGEKGQFEVIPLGIDLETFDNVAANRHILRAELGVKDYEVLVGFVGRLTAIKNIPLFLQAIKIYLEQRDAGPVPELKFVIIGDGELRAALEAEANELGLRDVVTFLGNRNDPEVFYAGLDIVALTSHNEGTPLSLIEAMACGKAVISTAVGGVIDLVGETGPAENGFKIGERGILVTSNSAEHYFNGLTYLVENEELRKKLGENGKFFTAEHYSKTRLFNDIKALYRDLV